MPFDRLIKAVDGWAAHHPSEEILAQIGPGAWQPTNIKWVQFMAPAEFRRNVEKAKVVVSHAGMGTVLTALELAKPLLLLPRRGHLMETRNDHQVDTAHQLANAGRATIAMDEKELVAALDNLDQLPPPKRIGSYASPELLETIRRFVTQGQMPPLNSANKECGKLVEFPCGSNG